MKALTYALALLAALRLTRFITSDYLGHWTVVRPARRWALHRAGWHTPSNVPGDIEPDALWGEIDPHGDASKAVRLVSGLDCPFCVGFWATAGAVLLAVAANRGPRRRAAFQIIAGAFGANYITGHISSRLDS